MLIKLQNNKTLNNKGLLRRSNINHIKAKRSIIPISNSFIGRINPSRPFRVLAPFGLLLLSLSLSFGVNSSNTYAASVSITVTGSSSSSIDLLPTATTRDFKKSGNIEVTVSATDTTTGYTLTIEDKNNDNQRLTGASSSSNYLTSISSPTTESDFSSNLTTANSTYDNKWGFLPSKLNGEANTNYQPGPKKTTATTIDVTDNPNARTYTFAIGARVDNNQAEDTYTGTFTLAASVNATQYSIGYVDLLSNMPTATAGSTTNATVTLSGTTPSRPGYTFKGWCSKSTSNETCSGTTYAKGGTYTLSNGAITNLYAMWEPATFDSLFAAAGYSKSNGYYKMQDMNSTICSKATTGLQGQLIDSRDNTVYWIGKQADGKCWMTQNLDLALTATALTSANTDLNSKTSWTPPTTARTANATVDHTNKTASGWADNNNVPFSAEGGDTYYYTSGNDNDDTKYASLSACTGASHTESDCKHYHVGNYYNWSAAVAMDSTSAYTAQYTSAPDSICPKGWRLPVGLSDSTITDNSAEFASLLYRSGVIPQITSSGSDAFTSTGSNSIRTAPLYSARSGYVDNTTLNVPGYYGFYWSSSVSNSSYAYNLHFYSRFVISANVSGRNPGFSVRCLAR